MKIAFFDVDGTLLPMGRRQISEKTIRALNGLRRSGVLLCMATGRSYPAAPRFPGAEFDLLMTFNGAYVTAGNEVLFKNPFGEADKRRILQNLARMGRAAAVSNEHFIRTNGTDADLEQYFAFGNEKLVIAEDFAACCKTELYQIMCACRKEEYERILEGTQDAQITAWWDRAADIVPRSAGKGNAVRAVLARYGWKKEEAIAFGDGQNDIGMLEAVGTGVAMGNAKDEVKASADAVCPPAEEDGIYAYCLENRLIAE